MKKLIFFISLYFISNSLYAFELNGKFYQGNLIVGKTESQAKVFVDEKRVKVSKQGFFVFGLSKDRKNDVSINVIKNNITETQIKKVYKKKYKIQRIDGLPKKQVTPPKEFYERIKNDNK